MNQSSPEYVLFFVDGGAGKNVMGTAVVRAIATEYPESKIVVVASHPAIFKFNPRVYRIYRHGNTPHFHDDYITPGNSIVLKPEPYYHNDYIQKNRHLVECRCEMLDIPCQGIEPEIYFSKKEQEWAVGYTRSKNKPVAIVQYQGGAQPTQHNPEPKQFVRSVNPHVIQRVVVELAKKFHVIQMKLPNQQNLQHAENGQFTLRQIMALIPHANRLLMIDSLGQHIAAACKKQAVVMWSATSPKALGYDTHINIIQEACPTPMCHRPNSFLFDNNHDGQPWECPYGEACTVHDEGEILEALNAAT